MSWAEEKTLEKKIEHIGGVIPRLHTLTTIEASNSGTSTGGYNGELKVIDIRDCQGVLIGASTVAASRNQGGSIPTVYSHLTVTLDKGTENERIFKLTASGYSSTGTSALTMSMTELFVKKNIDESPITISENSGFIINAPINFSKSLEAVLNTTLSPPYQSGSWERTSSGSVSYILK